jgi:hypothetical protein
LKRSFQSKWVVTALRRPALPARNMASPNETEAGMSTTTVTSETTSPRKITPICCTSDHVTALMPPSTV